jgi:hypothetical protein
MLIICYVLERDVRPGPGLSSPTNNPSSTTTSSSGGTSAHFHSGVKVRVIRVRVRLRAEVFHLPDTRE